ncbi:MAG: hypothetical protein Q8916_09980 [Bacteroidota bacterium]|nr:hypothetical protein [Bacteroidota bacterium]MDP4230716.1 hypothetical protein [Bacteroidota bacterium]MDP4236492.1 hypothetical protein [Bacteroidota bacterium]
MNKIPLILFAGLLIGCSQDKPQPEAKAPDTVVVVQEASAAKSHVEKQTPKPKKDAIDKTDDALDKANTTVARTTVTVDKAAELKKKTDVLLGK